MTTPPPQVPDWGQIWRNWLNLLFRHRVPSGAMMEWLTDTPPDGWLECDGSSLNKNSNSALFAVIGYSYGGSGDNFSLPDFRGRFKRIFDNGAGIDPNAASRTDRGDGTTGDNVGTLQADEFKSHTHAYGNTNQSTGTSGSSSVKDADNSGSIATSATGGSETRPVNIYVMQIIKV